MEPLPKSSREKHYRITVGDGIRIGIGLALVYFALLLARGFVEIVAAGNAAQTGSALASETAPGMSPEELSRSGYAIKEFVEAREATGADIQFLEWGEPSLATFGGTSCWEIEVKTKINGETTLENFYVQNGKVFGRADD